MSRRQRSRAIGLLGAAVVVLLPLSVYLGSGSRAGDRCTAKFFVSGGEWSWTHFATRCQFGEPAQVGYAYSLASVTLLIVIVTLAFVSLRRAHDPG